MKKVQEYKILPQTEHDIRGGGGGGGSHYPGDEYQYGGSSRNNNCLGSFLIILTAIFILLGSTALIITAFWSKEFHTTLDLYWPNHPIGGSHSEAIWLEQNNSSSSSSSSSANSDNSTEFPIDLHNSSSSSTSSEESSESGEIEEHHNGTSHHNQTITNSTDTDMEINETNIGLKFAEAMRQFEKQMEKLSGIHQAELVIPLFMLVTFMSTLALISLCCCLMSKRREHRQRKLLGKIITDLQTGDSKTILLGSKDEDF